MGDSKFFLDMDLTIKPVKLTGFAAVSIKLCQMQLNGARFKFQLDSQKVYWKYTYWSKYKKSETSP